MFKYLNKNLLIKILVASMIATTFSLTGCKKKEKEDTLVSSSIKIDELKEDQIERPELREGFEDAKKQNSDTVAWIQIPGTTIDNPVVQDLENKGKGRDEYYLHRDFTGKQVAIGKESAIMSDKNNILTSADELSNNVIISGHNVDLQDNPNGKMFAQLGNFRNIEFAKKTPYIFLTINDKDLVYEVFASYYSEVRFGFHEPKNTKKEMAEMIKEAKKRSDFVYDVDVDEDDKVLTLYTCTYRFGGYKTLGYYRTKYVVQARLVPDGEYLKGSANLKMNPDKQEVDFTYCAYCNQDLTVEKCSANGGLCDKCKNK